MTKHKRIIVVGDYETHFYQGNDIVYNWCIKHSNKYGVLSSYRNLEKVHIYENKEKGCIYYKGIDVDDYIKLIQGFNRDTTIFYHNGGGFDFHYLKEGLRDFGLTKSMTHALCKKDKNNIKMKKYCNCGCKASKKKGKVIINPKIETLEKGLFSTRMSFLKKMYKKYQDRWKGTKREHTKDYLSLWNKLNPNEYRIQARENQSILILDVGIEDIKRHAGVEWKTRRVEHRDSRELFEGSIKSFGENLAKHYNDNKWIKYETPFNKPKGWKPYENIEQFKNDKREWDYVEQDVDILYEWIILMDKVFSMKYWKLTKGETAYTAWQKSFGEKIMKGYIKRGWAKKHKLKGGSLTYKFLNKKKKWSATYTKPAAYKYLIEKYIPVSWLNKPIKKGWNQTIHEYLFRNYYYGGLVHVNEKYRGRVVKNVYGIDINGSYSAQMTKYIKVPTGKPSKIYKKGYDFKFYRIRILKNLTNKKGLPWIPTLNISLCAYEYNKTLKAGQVIYLTDIDYEKFLEKYNVNPNDIEINIELYFKPRLIRTFFIHFINDWQKKKVRAKETNNIPLYFFAKFMLNCLYGKFGTKELRKSRIYFEGYESEHWPIEQTKRVNEHYLPFAIVITSLARMNLVDAVGDNYKDFIYCDTDSLYMRVLPKHLEYDDLKLGSWKIEHSNIEILVRRAKQYIIFKNGKYIPKYSGIDFDLEPIHPEFDDFIEGIETPNQKTSGRRKGKIFIVNEFVKQVHPIWHYDVMTEQEWGKPFSWYRKHFPKMTYADMKEQNRNRYYEWIMYN